MTDSPIKSLLGCYIMTIKTHLNELSICKWKLKKISILNFMNKGLSLCCAISE